MNEILLNKKVSVEKVLGARLEQETRRHGQPIDQAKVEEIIKRIVSPPVLDGRSADKIMGYDEHGLPG
jgi:hypothetical protein